VLKIESSRGETLDRAKTPKAAAFAAGTQPVERGGGCVRVEFERSGAANVCDPRVLVDDADPLGPRGECRAHRVVHRVDEHLHRQSEAFHAKPGSGEAVLDRHMVREQHLLVEVRLELPAVGRVRLADVHERHRRSLAVTAIHRLDVAGPATKRRSGEAAENEEERTPADERLEPHRSGVLAAQELEVRQSVADAEAIGPAEARDRRHGRLPLVAREGLDVLLVSRMEVGVRSHCAGLWR
jgi:hypothetical protein